MKSRNLTPPRHRHFPGHQHIYCLYIHTQYIKHHIIYDFQEENINNDSPLDSSSELAGAVCVRQISEILDDFALFLFYFAISSVLEEEKQDVLRS